jgi:hypothetical protein
MIKTSKIAYLYLSIFIAALVSMTLPQPLYMAIIFVMNLSVAITLISRSPNQPLVSQISLTVLIISTIAFNAWAAFQTVAYFSIHPGTFLTLSIYLLIYYLLAMITLKPSFIMKSVIFIKSVIGAPFSAKKGLNNISSVTEIFDLISMAKTETIKLRVKINSILVGDFTISDIDENKVSIEASESLSDFILKNPATILHISMLINSENYNFSSKIVSLSPFTIKFPKTVTKVNTVMPKNQQKEDKVADTPSFNPSSITTAIKTDSKNIEIILSELTTSTLKFTTTSAPLITFLNTSAEYINVSMFVKGGLIEVQAIVSGKKNNNEDFTYDAELKNVNAETIGLISELIK